MVLSRLADARVSPSGLKAMDKMGPAWNCRVVTFTFGLKNRCALKATPAISIRSATQIQIGAPFLASGALSGSLMTVPREVRVTVLCVPEVRPPVTVPSLADEGGRMTTG